MSIMTMRWIGLVLVAVAVLSGPAMLGAQTSDTASEGTLEDEVFEEEATGVETGDVVETQDAAPPGIPGLISVDFKDADIRQVLRIISLKAGVDIVAGPDVEGLVTIKLTNVPWESALEIILKTYGFSYERKGDVVRVMTLAQIEQEALSNEVFVLNYSKASEVTDILKDMLSERGKVKYDERTNTVIVTDLSANIFQLRQVIERLDKATPQVKIETKIVETNLQKDDHFGIDWFDSAKGTLTPAKIHTTFPYPTGASLGNIGEEFFPKPLTTDPTGGTFTAGKVPETGGTFTFGTLTADALLVTVNALKQRVNTNIISHPTIVTLDNKEAFVQVGEDVNIPNFQIDSSTGKATVTGVTPRATGVILHVTPHVNQAREIVVDLSPEITEVKEGFDTFAQDVSFPRFTVQKVDTQVRLRDGETLVIGGLVKRKNTSTQNKVPILGDIPILGVLFTDSQFKGDPQQDLLIFLTVKLVEESAIQQTASNAP